MLYVVEAGCQSYCLPIMDYLNHLLPAFTNAIKTKTNAELFGIASAATLCVYAVRKIFWIPFNLYFLSRYIPGVHLHKLGTWAIVTGATDGIGKEYARALASKGLNVILISRSEDKLNKVKAEITRDYSVSVKTIQADFTSTDIYDRIAKELEGLEIAVLVNNVGMAQTFTPFLDTPNLNESSKDILSVNCLSMAAMCAVVLPSMIERERGVIVNLSSCLGYMGSVYSSNYAATKAYNLMLSQNLQRSYSSTGVIIQSLTPGMIRTKLLNQLVPERDAVSKTIGQTLLSTSVQSYVKSAIATIGWSDNCHGHAVYYYMDFLLAVIPDSIFDKMATL